MAAHKAYSRHDGIVPNDVADVSPEFLDESKTRFYEKEVVITQAEGEELEKRTRKQAESEEWKSERRKRLTTSTVGGIAKMRKTTKRSKTVRDLLYSTFRGNEATRYGMEMETTAQQEYITHQQQSGHSGLVVEKCGLFVSPENPWLAASPDGMVHDPCDSSQPLGLVEIKNPHSARHMTLSEACGSSTFCLEQQERDGQVMCRLKRRHNYYYQIQCQLYCVDREWCDFVLRTDKDLHIERIYRDRTWWEQQLPKLNSFYFNALHS